MSRSSTESEDGTSEDYNERQELLLTSTTTKSGHYSRHGMTKSTSRTRLHKGTSEVYDSASSVSRSVSSDSAYSRSASMSGTGSRDIAGHFVGDRKYRKTSRRTSSGRESVSIASKVSSNLGSSNTGHNRASKSRKVPRIPKYYSRSSSNSRRSGSSSQTHFKAYGNTERYSDSNRTYSSSTPRRSRYRSNSSSNRKYRMPHYYKAPSWSVSNSEFSDSSYQWDLNQATSPGKISSPAQSTSRLVADVSPERAKIVRKSKASTTRSNTFSEVTKKILDRVIQIQRQLPICLSVGATAASLLFVILIVLLSLANSNLMKLKRMDQNVKFDGSLADLTESLKQKLKLNFDLQSSCRDILRRNPRSPSGYYPLLFSTGLIHIVYCDMTLSCGGYTGGWMRLAELDTDDCFPGLDTRVISGIKTCKSDDLDCTSIHFSSGDFIYSNVCGIVTGFGSGMFDGFHTQAGFIRETFLSDNYLDGISITVGLDHVWSLVLGGCRCESGPSFIGEDWSCDNTCLLQCKRLLWHQIYCGKKLPFFKRLPRPTNEDMQFRICQDDSVTNEKLSLLTARIYVR